MTHALNCVDQSEYERIAASDIGQSFGLLLAGGPRMTCAATLRRDAYPLTYVAPSSSWARANLDAKRQQLAYPDRLASARRVRAGTVAVVLAHDDAMVGVAQVPHAARPAIDADPGRVFKGRVLRSAILRVVAAKPPLGVATELARRAVLGAVAQKLAAILGVTCRARCSVR